MASKKLNSTGLVPNPDRVAVLAAANGENLYLVNDPDEGTVREFITIKNERFRNSEGPHLIISAAYYKSFDASRDFTVRPESVLDISGL